MWPIAPAYAVEVDPARGAGLSHANFAEGGPRLDVPSEQQSPEFALAKPAAPERPSRTRVVPSRCGGNSPLHSALPPESGGWRGLPRRASVESARARCRDA